MNKQKNTQTKPAALNKETVGPLFNHQSLSVSQTFEGPLPPPSTLAGYRNIDPSYPDKIMHEFQANSEHVRVMESKSFEATVERDKRGQYMAFTIAVSLLIIVGLALHLGNVVFASFSGLGFFAFIIAAFLPQYSNNKKS